jgi:hypothetical protein
VPHVLTAVPVLKFRGLLLALTGFLVTGLGYAAAPMLGNRAAIFLMIAGMLGCAAGFIIHLVQMFRPRDRR